MRGSDCVSANRTRVGSLYVMYREKERERERYPNMLEDEVHLRGGWDAYSTCFLFNFPTSIA